MPLRLPIALLAFSIAVIWAFWWGMGRPVSMPPSPLAVGDKIPCVSYAPFRRGQSPFQEDIVISAEQIDDDFAHLATVTNCVRTYAVDQGLENVPALARKHGLQVIMGIWLGREAPKNALQVETAIRLAKANPDVLRMVVVGNEALLRGEISEADLGGIIKKVKSSVPVPVTYADVWEFWVRHKALADLVDVVTVHILPYWEDHPVPAAQAGQHIADIRAHVGEVFAGKPILIGETGWPSEGRMRWGARATPADQALALHDIVALQRTKGYEVNLIEAFDQPWKRILEGTVGGYWGLLDADTREPKFQWGAPISNYPAWSQWAVLGSALAVLIFAASLTSARGEDVPARRWISVAVLTMISGSAIGLAVHMHAVGARTPVELGQTSGYIALSAFAPLIAAVGLVRGIGPVSLSQLFAKGHTPPGPSRWLAIVGVLTAVLATYLALGLVFDPRYREFATSTLIGPVAGFALASLLSGRAVGERLAERIFAAVLTASAVAIVLQERISNWEALCFALALLILAGTLWGVPGAQKRPAAAPAPAH